SPLSDRQEQLRAARRHRVGRQRRRPDQRARRVRADVRPAGLQDDPLPNTTWSGLAASAGAMTNPDLGVFSVSLNGTQTRAPDASSVTCINPNAAVISGDFICVQPGVSIFGSSPTGQPPFNAFSIPTDYKTPMYHYFHATVQREIFRGNAVTVTYLGSRGRDQSWFRDINGPALGTATTAIQVNRPFFTQFPTLKHVIQLTNDGKSWYDALQLS